MKKLTVSLILLVNLSAFAVGKASVQMVCKKSGKVIEVKGKNIEMQKEACLKLAGIWSEKTPEATTTEIKPAATPAPAPVAAPAEKKPSSGGGW